jgi:hypothetical protein
MPETEKKYLTSLPQESGAHLYEAYVRFTLAFKRRTEENFALLIRQRPALQEFIDGHLSPVAVSAFRAKIDGMTLEQKLAFFSIISSDPEVMERTEIALVEQLSDERIKIVPKDFPTLYAEQARRIFSQE